jgi:hypothetical protein
MIIKHLKTKTMQNQWAIDGKFNLMKAVNL